MTKIKCDKPVIARMFWPGEHPIFICAEHRKKAVDVSNAMGFQLYIEQIESVEEGTVCEQIIEGRRLSDDPTTS